VLGVSAPASIQHQGHLTVQSQSGRQFWRTSANNSPVFAGLARWRHTINTRPSHSPSLVQPLTQSTPLSSSIYARPAASTQRQWQSSMENQACPSLQRAIRCGCPYFSASLLFSSLVSSPTSSSESALEPGRNTETIPTSTGGGCDPTMDINACPSYAYKMKTTMAIITIPRALRSSGHRIYRSHCQTDHYRTSRCLLRLVPYEEPPRIQINH
jgi:hypothetical protein